VFVTIEDETGIANLIHQVRRQAASPLDRALPMEDMRTALGSGDLLSRSADGIAVTPLR
jgi:hypothetical protein